MGLFRTEGQDNNGNIVAAPDGRIWFTLGARSAVAAFEPFVPAPAAPDVSGVSPNSGPATGGTSVVITGYNVGTATQVLFGTTPATSFTVVGPGQVEAVAPPHPAGQVDITVVTPSGTTAVSAASKFFYSSPACGRVITQNTTLHADIGPCYHDGVVIGADNVTLNLGGKRIYGFPGPSDGHAVGVRLPMRTGVTVNNGTVTGFDAGVVVRGGGSNVLKGLIIQDNVGRNRIGTELGDGIFIEESAANQVLGNTVSRNGIYDGIGIFGPGANANIVKDNVVENTVGPRGHGPAGDGIIINGASGDGSPTFIESTRVENNVVRNNASAGIANVNHVGGRVVNNTVIGNGATNSFGNGIGVSVGFNWTGGPTNMLIQGNKIHRNGVDGIRIGNPVGFNTGNPTGNQILDNDAADNARKPSVDTYEGSPQGYDLHDRNPDCADNVWLRNIWGSGGYSPPCTATGGSGPAPPSVAAANAPQAAAASSADTTDWMRALNHGRH
ncbi:MAG: right-handed parallel beta-helix repeat-containing protein [Actinobacteria bacterium]|nr:right-handed parallel beta-helix repeat-containing protein [Actinomycetota bacterium]